MGVGAEGADPTAALGAAALVWAEHRGRSWGMGQTLTQSALEFLMSENETAIVTDSDWTQIASPRTPTEPERNIRGPRLP